MDGPMLDRRTFIKGAGATAGVATVGVGSQAIDSGPVQEAEAIPPLILGAAAIGGSAALGWALREFEVLGADDPPTGLTPSALMETIRNIARTRQSTNSSTFVDNRNLISSGIENSAYADGKVAAIDALNAQKSQSEVQTAATSAATSYELTVKKNLLKSWNESINELSAMIDRATNHPDFIASDAIYGSNPNHSFANTPGTRTEEITPDGDTFELQTPIQSTANTELAYEWSPVAKYRQAEGEYTDWNVKVADVNSGELYVTYLGYQPWNDLYTSISTAFDNVRDGLITWIDGVYSSVQAGELDTADLLTPKELAAMTSDDEDFNQAIADLMALNVAVDFEREAEIRLPEIGATLRGSLSVSGETTLSAGTVDPSADSLSYYFTYDVSTGSGTWDAYNQGIDGGTLTFTKEPFPSALYVVSTAAGEKAEVTSSDFTDQGDGTFTVDLSEKLDTAITNAESVEYYSQTDETQYETVLLTAPFEIVTFRDSEGNEVDSAGYTKAQPQDDTNYITEEEWKQQQQRYEELIEKYEKAKAGGGGGFSVDVGNIPPAGLALGAGALLAFLLGNKN